MFPFLEKKVKLYNFTGYELNSSYSDDVLELLQDAMKYCCRSGCDQNITYASQYW